MYPDHHPDHHPDSPEVPVHRTARGFSVDAAALRAALEGGAATITFIAPEGWHFGDDRRLHMDDPPDNLITFGADKPDREVYDQQQRQAREIHGVYGRTLEDPGMPGDGPPP
jgi:hypothetical protein